MLSVYINEVEYKVPTAVKTLIDDLKHSVAEKEREIFELSDTIEQLTMVKGEGEGIYHPPVTDELASLRTQVKELNKMQDAVRTHLSTALDIIN